jgi:cytochrome c oxidase assembly factor CtaG
LLAARPVQRLRFLAHPFVALPLWAVNLYTWHLAAAYEAALRHPAIHALEHGLFFTTGLLMWAAVAEPLPGPEWFGAGWKAVYTLAVRTIQAGLANVFFWSGATLYDFYETGERTAGVSPLTDQQIAGAVMFIEGAIVTLLVFAWLFLRWMQEAEIAQRLVEAGYDPARSVRSARHGGSGLLREPPPPD